MMKNWQIVLYAFIGAFFTGGIIFSVTSTFTEGEPFNWVILITLMIILFIVFIILLFQYKKHRPNIKDMEDCD